MFLGEYIRRVDEKGRIPLPPDFKDELKAGLFLTRGSEGCITAYPPSEWAKFKERMAVLPADSARRRRVTRFYFSSAFAAELDGQGRVMLPPPLRQYAGIEHDAVVVGCDNCVEIWAKAAWEAEVPLASEAARKASEVAEEQ